LMDSKRVLFKWNFWFLLDATFPFLSPFFPASLL
jgi:hypothetical protein